MIGTSFPGMKAALKRTVRAEVNPMDKSTIFSIFPKRIMERKHTIQPGEFIIEPGSPSSPTRLVVGGASWWREIDEHQPLLEIPIGSTTIAESVVRDYCNGLLAYSEQTSKPGLFWVPGDVSIADLMSKHSKVLASYVKRQEQWFKELVKLGDALWARTNGNPLAVSDDMRLAAKELGIEKEWLGTYVTQESVRCVACGFMRNPNFPICPNCKTIIDSDKAKKLGLGQAQ